MADEDISLMFSRPISVRGNHVVSPEQKYRPFSCLLLFLLLFVCLFADFKRNKTRNRRVGTVYAHSSALSCLLSCSCFACKETCSSFQHRPVKGNGRTESGLTPFYKYPGHGLQELCILIKHVAAPGLRSLTFKYKTETIIGF